MGSDKTGNDNGRAKINKLGRREMRQIEDWVQARRNIIKETRPTYEKTANEATSSGLFKFPITKTNILSAAQAIGFKWPVPLKGPNQHSTRNNKEMARQRRQDLLTVVESLIALYTLVGETSAISAPLLHLSRRLSTEIATYDREVGNLATPTTVSPV